MLKLYHVTLRSNLPSIRREGIVPQKALGRIQAVWIASEGLVPWVIQHLASQRGWKPSDMCWIRLRAKVSQLVRRRRGIYLSPFTIPPAMIVCTGSCA